MATRAQCRQALDTLATRLSGDGAAQTRKHALDRSLSCHVSDLDVTFTGRLADGALTDITDEPAPPAQLRLSMTSDELLALTEGRDSFTSAWAAGRLHVQGSVLDLVRLRSLL